MKVIFVDDSVIWRDEIQEVTAQLGFAVTTYSDPRDVDVNDLLTADAVVTDNKFRNRGYLGIDFIRSIRASGFSGQVILYTSHPRQDELLAVRELHADVIEKSIFPEALIRSLSAGNRPRNCAAPS